MKKKKKYEEETVINNWTACQAKKLQKRTLPKKVKLDFFKFSFARIVLNALWKRTQDWKNL